jgi:hypothetical protein
VVAFHTLLGLVTAPRPYDLQAVVPFGVNPIGRTAVFREGRFAGCEHALREAVTK